VSSAPPRYRRLDETRLIITTIVGYENFQPLNDEFVDFGLAFP
jgi:hypothetical protein